MKRIITAAFLLIAAVAGAQTIPQTPYLKLNLPPHGYQPYDVPVNANFTTIDTWAQTVQSSLQTQFKGTWASGTSYSQGQSVLYNGDYYISAISLNAGNIPSHTSIQWTWAGTTNSVAFPTGIPWTTTDTPPVTRTMTITDLDSVYGTTPGALLCWLDNTGACSVPPNGYVAPNKVPYKDTTSGTTATATPQQMASMFMQVNTVNPCTDGIVDGDGDCYPIPALQALASDGNGKPTTIGEVGYSCTGTSPQTCSVAWREDEIGGIFDPRRPRNYDGTGSTVTLSTDCAQAVINTVNAAVCAAHANPNINPIIKFPAGHYSGCGKGAIIPPNVTFIGQPGVGNGDYGGATILQSGDSSQPMFNAQSTYTASCNGTPVNITSGGGQRFEHISLNGNGTSANTDVGLYDTAGGMYFYDDAFTNFGGEGLKAYGLNSHGDKIFGASNLGWFMWSGAYNPTSFADTNWYASLDLQAQDSQWDHVVEYGWLQDSGWYNRYYLAGVIGPGGPSSRLSDGFIQINPHNIINVSNSDNGRRIHDNRLDDSWFDSIWVGFFGGGNIYNNDITGYCTSPLLNPANFPTDPGGVSPYPNCSGIYEKDGGNSRVYWNNVGESGLWPAWPTYAFYQEPNNSGQSGAAAGIIEEPGYNIGGSFGSNWCCGNEGGDWSRSMIYTTYRYGVTGPVTGGTIPLRANTRVQVVSSNGPSTWTNFSAQYSDFVATIFLTSNDFIVPSSHIATCNNQTLTGADSGIFKGGVNGYQFWVRDAGYMTQLNCQAGSGSGTWSTAILTGGTASVTFSDGRTHSCIANDSTGVNAVGVTPPSTTSITFTGNPGDSIVYLCN